MKHSSIIESISFVGKLPAQIELAEFRSRKLSQPKGRWKFMTKRLELQELPVKAVVVRCWVVRTNWTALGQRLGLKLFSTPAYSIFYVWTRTNYGNLFAYKNILMLCLYIRVKVCVDYQAHRIVSRQIRLLWLRNHCTEVWSPISRDQQRLMQFTLTLSNKRYI